MSKKGPNEFEAMLWEGGGLAEGQEEETLREKEAKWFERKGELAAQRSKREELLEMISPDMDSDIVQRARHFLRTLSEPALFGSQEEREKVMLEVSQRFYKCRRRIRKDFVRLLPNREELCIRILGILYRKLSGSKVVRAPLLVGPPGAGKSFAVEALVKALNQNGIRTKLIRRTLIYNENAIKEIEMHLLGTEVYYSNAFPGVLAREVARKDVDLVVVFLDEVEKGMPHVYPLLLNLLDPAQPLEDCFLKGAFVRSPHDLRFKTFFVAAANQPEILLSIPEVRDRFEMPLYFQPYTPEEKVDLVLQLSSREFAQSFRKANKNELRKIAREMIKIPNLTFRDLLSLVEDFLLAKKLSYYQAPRPTIKMAERRPIGFRVSQ